MTKQQVSKDGPKVSSGPRAPPDTICKERKLSGIRQESVNYIGYHSEHDEIMKNVIMAEASNAEKRILETVSVAIFDCRRDQLWQKLLLCHGTKDQAVQLSYEEFTELITLVHHETLDKVTQLKPKVLKF